MKCWTVQMMTMSARPENRVRRQTANRCLRKTANRCHRETANCCHKEMAANLAEACGLAA
jgi:hypothetical protein